MIFHPAIIALSAGSLLVSLMLLYSAFHGIRILRNWDMGSGSESQLQLERRTYLISTLVACALGFQLLSLFLFIHTVDCMSGLFVGAMCAAGSLKVNPFGYPAIVLRVINSILAGQWLMINHADNKAFDYPLIRKKYGMLLVIMPLIVAETAIQGAYFMGLKPEVITSCCGVLFSADSEGWASGMAALPPVPVAIAFYGFMAATISAGILFYTRGVGPYLFAGLNLCAATACVIALICFISPYFYESPTHHCPFCILQGEYRYVGYAFYLTLLAGAAAGLGVGTLTPFQGVESLKRIIPELQRTLALVSILSYSGFVVVAVSGILFSNLRLTGY